MNKQLSKHCFQKGGGTLILADFFHEHHLPGRSLAGEAGPICHACPYGCAAHDLE